MCCYSGLTKIKTKTKKKKQKKLINQIVLSSIEVVVDDFVPLQHMFFQIVSILGGVRTELAKLRWSSTAFVLFMTLQ